MIIAITRLSKLHIYIYGITNVYHALFSLGNKASKRPKSHGQVDRARIQTSLSIGVSVIPGYLHLWILVYMVEISSKSNFHQTH